MTCCATRISEQSNRGLRLVLADAVNEVLAERYLTNDVLTLDEKDFRAVRPLTPGHRALRLLLQDGVTFPMSDST